MESDVDMLVDIASVDPYEYGDHYFALYDGLEDLFRRPIDLLESRALSNRFFLEVINNHKVDLYEA